MELKQLDEILIAHRLWRETGGEGGKRADLQRADLQRADLREADLWEADLWGAKLQGANLHHANLLGANLRRANLQGANLQGADLWGADLRGADLWDAKLQGAKLQGANPWDANLRGTDLRNTGTAIGQTPNGWAVIVTPTHVRCGCKQLGRKDNGDIDWHLGRQYFDKASVDVKLWPVVRRTVEGVIELADMNKPIGGE